MTKPNRQIPIFLTIILGVLIGALSSVFLQWDIITAWFVILVNIILIIIVGWFAWSKTNENGLFNIVVMFSLCFIAYNSILPIEVGFEYLTTQDITLDYPIKFGIENYVLTTFLSLISGIMFIFGSKIAKLFSFKSKLLAKELDINLSFLGGTVLFLIGFILFFLDYSRIGGYLNAMSMDRVVRLNLLSQTPGNLPCNTFILVGIAFMAYGSFSLNRPKIKTYLTFVFCLFYLILLLISGDRRYSLYIILVLLTVYSFKKKPIKLNKKIIIIGICIYILFAIFQNSRWMLPLIVSGRLTFADAYELFMNNFSISFLLPGSTEFAGPYFSLLYYSEMNSNLLGGFSYLYALPYLLPRSIYPGFKLPTISQDFALQIHQTFYAGRQGVVGWGFSPIAESLANFGYLGPVIVFLALGFILSSISKIQNKGLGVIIMAVISPIAFNLNRADFANAFMEITYNILLAFLVAIVVWIVQYAVSHNIINNGVTSKSIQDKK